MESFLSIFKKSPFLKVHKGLLILEMLTLFSIGVPDLDMDLLVGNFY